MGQTREGLGMNRLKIVKFPGNLNNISAKFGIPCFNGFSEFFATLLQKYSVGQLDKVTMVNAGA